MDRNSVIGIIIIALIFVVWGVLNKPNEAELEKRRAYNDSIAAVQQQQQTQEVSKVIETEIAKTDSIEKATQIAQLGDMGQAAIGTNKFYTLENDLVKFTVSTKGGRPYSAQLKNYQTFDSLPLILFDGDSTIFSLNFNRQYHDVRTNDLFFNVDGQIPEKIVVTEKPESLALRLMVADSSYIEYIYTLLPNSYQVDMQIKMFGLLDRGTRGINLQWEIFSPKQEKGWKNEASYSSIYYKPNGNDVDNLRLRANKPLQEEIPSEVEWIGFKDQFFASVIMSGDKRFNYANIESVPMPENGKYIRHFKSEIGLPLDGSTYESTMPVSFYFGPAKYKSLKKDYAEERLYDMVAVGNHVIKWINQYVIINLFNFLSKGISNYGLIILIMTLIIKSFLLPLTFKSYMSQAKMRVVKPMVEEATGKIPKEKAMERQQATMAIYKKVGVSPFGGCLPMILQMPFLFAMFRFFPTSIELRQESFLWATDLSTYDSIVEWDPNFWPFLTNIFGSHISLFTILMTVTTIISMKTNNTSMNDSQPGMKTMMYIMPVMFMFFLNKFSSALTYYYFLANVITFGQNFLFKSMVNEEEVLRKLQAKKAKPKNKSKWQQRIENMQKAQKQSVKKRK